MQCNWVVQMLAAAILLVTVAPVMHGVRVCGGGRGGAVTIYAVYQHLGHAAVTLAHLLCTVCVY